MDKVNWKIDEAEDLPLAVIEDTEDGLGVCEIGLPGTTVEDATPQEIAVAQQIVDIHNNRVEQTDDDVEGIISS